MAPSGFEPLLGNAKESVACCTNLMKGFRDFIIRGDVVSLAVAVVVGSSFNSLVDAFVADWITPLIGVFFKGSGEFAEKSFSVQGSVFKYGDFVNVFITFLINCFVIYFLVVLPMNRLLESAKEQAEGAGILEAEPPAEVAPKDTRPCPECLSEIPCAAKRCKCCTAVVKPMPPQVVTA